MPENCKRAYHVRKCDTQKPTCTSCTLAKLTCEYNTVTSRQAERNAIRNYERSTQKFQSVLDLLRNGNEADSAAVLRRIRETNDIEDAVTTIADAQLLMPGAQSSVGRQAEGAFPRDRLLRSPCAFWPPISLLYSSLILLQPRRS
jgi:hypothetical protein